jgi:hypothetical protein
MNLVDIKTVFTRAKFFAKPIKVAKADTVGNCTEESTVNKVLHGSTYPG